MTINKIRIVDNLFIELRNITKNSPVFLKVSLLSKRGDSSIFKRFTMPDENNVMIGNDVLHVIKEY